MREILRPLDQTRPDPTPLDPWTSLEFEGDDLCRGKKVEPVVLLSEALYSLCAFGCAGGNTSQVERTLPGDAKGDAQGRRAGLRGHQKHRGEIIGEGHRKTLRTRAPLR